MKKIYWYVLAIVAVIVCCLCLIFCHKEDPQPQPEPVVELTFNEAIQQDYDYLASHHEKFRFNEVQTILNTTLSDGRENVKIASMMSVAQVHDTVFYLIRKNGLNDSVVIDYELGLWVGDVNFTLPVNIDFEQALVNLTDSCDSLPHTRYMTLRNPLGPEAHEYPYYIFGNDRIGKVTVNAGTGAVNK